MRKVILDTIISLDGYCTSPKNQIDWFDFELLVRDAAEELNGSLKVVFSRTLADTPWGPAALTREDPASAVAKLKREPGKDMVVVGSGTLASALVGSDLVDEYRIRVRPIILGAGKPIFVDQNARH